MDPGEEYDNFIKNHETYDEKKNKITKKLLRNIAYEFIESKITNFRNEKKKLNSKEYWLVFPNSGIGRREDANAMYSKLVYCYTKEQAILIISTDTDQNALELDAIKVNLNTIDTMNKYFIP